MAFLQGFPMLNCGDEIAQLNGWDYKNDPDRVEDSRNLHRTKFNWEDAKQRTRKGTQMCIRDRPLGLSSVSDQVCSHAVMMRRPSGARVVWVCLLYTSKRAGSVQPSLFLPKFSLPFLAPCLK